MKTGLAAQVQWQARCFIYITKFPIFNIRYILTLACYTHAKSASLKSPCVHCVTMPGLEPLGLEELLTSLQPSHFHEKPTNAKEQFILLSFSPILLSGSSFFWPIMFKTLLQVSIFFSKLNYIASYLTMTSYTLYTSTAYTHQGELKLGWLYSCVVLVNANFKQDQMCWLFY